MVPRLLVRRASAWPLSGAIAPGRLREDRLSRSRRDPSPSRCDGRNPGPGITLVGMISGAPGRNTPRAPLDDHEIRGRTRSSPPRMAGSPDDPWRPGTTSNLRPLRVKATATTFSYHSMTASMTEIRLLWATPGAPSVQRAGPSVRAFRVLRRVPSSKGLKTLKARRREEGAGVAWSPVGGSHSPDHDTLVTNCMTRP
jgi:hypothetical protein